jgi:hypothetical protein
MEAGVMTTSAALAKIRAATSLVELRTATAEAISALSYEAQLGERLTAIELKMKEKEAAI